MSRLAKYFEAPALENRDEAVLLGVSQELMTAVEADVAVADNLFASVEADSELMEQYEHIATGLEELANYAESTLDDGGLSKDAASVMGLYANHMTTQLQIQQSVVPSVESFGGESECKTATTVAVEGLKETAKKVWEAFKTAMNKTLRKIILWLVKLKTSVGSTKKAAEELVKQAGKIGDGKAKVTEVPFVKLTNLHINGKVPTNFTTAISETYDLYNQVLDGIYSKMVTEGKTAISNYEAMLELLVKGATKAEVKESDSYKWFIEYDKETAAKYEAVKDKDMCGGLVYSKPADRIRLVNKEYKVKLEDKPVLAILSADELKSIGETIIAMCDTVEVGNKNLNELVEIRTKMIELSDKAISANMDNVDIFECSRIVAKIYSDIVGNPITTSLVNITSTAKAILANGNAHLGQYEVPAAE